jgi:hypothetical protein
MYHMYLYIHTHVAFLGVQRNGICWYHLVVPGANWMLVAPCAMATPGIHP